MTAVIRFSPDKFTTIEFSLSVAASILSDEYVLTDSRGIVGIDKQQTVGFVLTNELSNVITYAKEQVIKNREAVEFSAETYWGSVWVEAALHDGRLSVYVDTRDNRIATFKNIVAELVDFQAAYAS